MSASRKGARSTASSSTAAPGADGRRPRHVAQQRDLAEHLPGAQDAHLTAADDDIRRALSEQVQAIARLALVDDRRPRRDGHVDRAVRQALDDGRGERLEHGHSTEQADVPQQLGIRPLGPEVQRRGGERHDRECQAGRDHRSAGAERHDQDRDGQRAERLRECLGRFRQAEYPGHHVVARQSLGKRRRRHVRVGPADPRQHQHQRDAERISHEAQRGDRHAEGHGAADERDPQPLSTDQHDARRRADERPDAAHRGQVADGALVQPKDIDGDHDDEHAERAQQTDRRRDEHHRRGKPSVGQHRGRACSELAGEVTQ